MKTLTLIVSFFITSVMFSQKTVTGIVIDNKTKKPLPFANIVTNLKKGLITNADGTFEFNYDEKTSALTISYVGYKTQTLKINPPISFYYKIELTKDIQQLNEVVLSGNKNSVLTIIKEAIKRRKLNDPENILKSYKFNAYNKLLLTANPDSINGAVDSIFIKKRGQLKFEKVDSTNYILKKQLSQSHIYMTEKVSEFSFTKQKGQRETILASRMAGFKEPINEIISLKIQSFSFYKNKYTLFGNQYVNPISKNAINVYNYRILDTVVNDNRLGYMIYYFPKEKNKKTGLEGVLYIDTQTYALHKAIAEIKDGINIKAIQKFKYYSNKKVWFPIEKEIRAKKVKNNNNISLFGNNIIFQNSTKYNDSTIIRTNSTNPEDVIQLITTEKNFDIELNQPVKIKGRGLHLEVVENASERDNDYWNKYRTDSITNRGLQTYLFTDSIVEAENYEKKIYVGRKLLKGYLPSKFFDFDLRNLIKYNNHEGFRLGMGLITNSNFSTKYRLNGYTVYGTIDKEFKFGYGGATRLNKHTDTWFGANYTNDLVETGSTGFITDTRTFSLFEPRLFNITSFYKTKRISSYITHDITQKISSQLQFNYSKIKPIYAYGYLYNGQIFNTYNISTVTASFQWNPFNEYMQTKYGKMASKIGHPQFAFQATQSFKNIFDSNFNFTKLDFRAYYELKPLNKNKTTFLIKAGLSFGDIPLTHLYHISPNQPIKNSIMRRFSVAGRDSFETMFFNEFFSNRYATIQTKHYLKRFKILNKVQPEVVLISRFAIGGVSDIEKHIDVDFNSLENGYFESGFELNKIYKGFGLSAMYRYGAYHLPKFDDNLSFKFTYYFTLGF